MKRGITAFVGLAVWMAGSTASAQNAPPPVSPPLVLVVPFDNASKEPGMLWLGEGSAVLMTEVLGSLGAQVIRREDRLRAFERLGLPPIAALSHATVIRLGQVVEAAEVVIGAFRREGDDLVARARTIRLDTGRISAEVVERGPLSNVIGIYERLARRIAPPALRGNSIAPPFPAPAAFEQYVKGLLADAPSAQVAFLTQAIKLQPAFDRARLALWDVHALLGNHREALAIARDVAPGSALSRQARFLEGISLVNLGETEAALEVFETLNRERPDPALLNNLGVVQLRRSGRGIEPATAGSALSYLGEAVKLDAGDPDLYFNLGYAFWLTRDVPGAVHWLREAVRRNAADDAAHYVLGVALQAAGSGVEATREKDLAKRLSTDYVEWEAKQRGANAAPPDLERLKLEVDVPPSARVDAALTAAEQRQQREVAAFHLDQARRLFDQERDEEAIAHLRRSVFLSPYDSAAHLLLARIYLRTGRQQEAVDALTIATWSDPANTEARDLLNSLR